MSLIGGRSVAFPAIGNGDWWGGHCLLNRPATAKTKRDHQIVSSEFSTPFGSGQSLAAVFNDNVSAGVSRLFGFGGPTAILRRIRAGAVFSLYRRAWIWLRSHVGKESLETVAPRITDRDAFGTVVAKGFTSSGVATRFHACPSDVFARGAHPVTTTPDLCQGVTMTAATFGKPSFQIAHVDIDAASAFAPTKKIASRISWHAFTNDGPKAKCISWLRDHLAILPRNFDEVYS